ncbi:LCP family protein [Gudongella sp. SC589]|jgi:LCP family protein required for cell wall assembly|uniref:LCP family protein n=1 Tax=Gudongella sp. SC589 TaxID=3385990 RepID=UPI0039048C13
MKKRKNNSVFIRVFVVSFLIFLSLLFLAGGFMGSKENHERFLLLGIDSSDYSEVSSVRSDTIMLVDMNTSSGEINIISIPRDTRAPIEGRKSPEKINHSFAYGGPELTLSTVRNLLGIELDHYVLADYQLVKEFVDLVGGVDIHVPMDMKYSDPVADPPLHIDLKEGEQTLDGEKALQYLRFRKGYKDADLGRVRAQQEFMKELFGQSIKLGNISKIPGMIGIYNNNMETNISFFEMVIYGVQSLRLDMDKINGYTLPGSAKMMEGLSYFIHDHNETEQLLIDIGIK